MIKYNIIFESKNLELATIITRLIKKMKDINPESVELFTEKIK